MKHIPILLLSPDATDAVPILDEDLSSVDTSMPVLRECLDDLKILSVETKPTKDGAGTNLVIVHETTASHMTTKNDTIGAGWKLTNSMLITPKGDMTEEMCRKNKATFYKAVFGNEPGGLFPLDKFVGRIVPAKITVRPEKDGFPEQNGIRYILPKGVK